MNHNSSSKKFLGVVNSALSLPPGFVFIVDLFEKHNNYYFQIGKIALHVVTRSIYFLHTYPINIIMYLYNVVHYVVCPTGCGYTLVFRFVVSECALFAGLDCFAVLWAESHLSERMVPIMAKPRPPI